MSRHPFRWTGPAFGLFFLACAGTWAVWKQELLTPREFSLTASAVLIVLGVLGVAATLWTSRTASPSAPAPTPTDEGVTHEATHPQP